MKFTLLETHVIIYHKINTLHQADLKKIILLGKT